MQLGCIRTKSVDSSSSGLVFFEVLGSKSLPLVENKTIRMSATNPLCTFSRLTQHIFRDEILEYLDHESVSILMKTLPEGPPFHLHDHFCFLHGRRFTNVMMDESNMEHFASFKALENDCTEGGFAGNNYNNNTAEWFNKAEEKCRYEEWMERNPICSRPANCQECYLLCNNHERCLQCNNIEVWSDFKACNQCGQGRCCTSCALGDGYNMVLCSYCEDIQCMHCFDGAGTPGRCRICNRTITFRYDYDCDALDSAKPHMSHVPAPEGIMNDTQCW
jgi:hypothetical protein